MKNSILITVLWTLSASMAFASLDSTLILCKNQKNVRTLRIEISEDQKCHAIYTKQGVDEEIGSGQNHNSCEEYISGVRKKLESVNWSCREIKEARTSSVQVLE